jgi:hypothetical protein
VFVGHACCKGVHVRGGGGSDERTIKRGSTALQCAMRAAAFSFIVDRISEEVATTYRLSAVRDDERSATLCKCCHCFAQ